MEGDQQSCDREAKHQVAHNSNPDWTYSNSIIRSLARIQQTQIKLNQFEA